MNFYKEENKQEEEPEENCLNIEFPMESEQP
jgi:hypothetical protein